MGEKYPPGSKNPFYPDETQTGNEPISPDHIIPLREIATWPDVEGLTDEQLKELASLPENYDPIPSDVNEKKSDRAWDQVKRNGQISEAELNRRAQLEQPAREALQHRIAEDKAINEETARRAAEEAARQASAMAAAEAAAAQAQSWVPPPDPGPNLGSAPTAPAPSAHMNMTHGSADAAEHANAPDPSPSQPSSESPPESGDDGGTDWVPWAVGGAAIVRGAVVGGVLGGPAGAFAGGTLGAAAASGG